MHIPSLSPRASYILSDYDPELCEVLCKFSSLAYLGDTFLQTLLESEEQYQNFQFFNNNGSQAFALTTDDFLVIVFRGTQVFEDPELIDIRPHIKIKKQLVGDAYVHGGYYEYYTNIREQIQEYVSKFQENRTILITGHSLGGAMSVVAGMVDYNDAITYAIGSPRTVSKNSDITKNIYTISLNSDFICNWPSKLSGLHHAGNHVFISKHGPYAWKNSIIHTLLGNGFLLLFTIMLPLTWCLGLSILLIRYSLKTHFVESYQEAASNCINIIENG